MFLTIRIKFIVLADDNGDNPCASDQTVQAQFDELNDAFQPYNIRFEPVPNQPLRVVVNSARFKRFCWWEGLLPLENCLGHGDCRYYTGEEREMKDFVWDTLGDLSGQLNVYVVNLPNESDPSYPVGIGYYPWCYDTTVHPALPGGTRNPGGVIVDASSVGGQTCGPGHAYPCGTLVHEIGHNLGLWHTYAGSLPGVCGFSCGEGPQCDGSPASCVSHHCDYVGDFCCDTPGTPKYSTCGEPFGPDACNQFYGATDYSNYMFDGGDGCWFHFTSQQAARTHCWPCDAAYGLRGWIAESIGTCCTGATCSQMPQGCCVNQGGTFYGASATCQDDCNGNGVADVCESPVGTCCVGTTCTVEAQVCCSAQGGAFIGVGNTCDDCNGNAVPDVCEAAALRPCCLLPAAGGSVRSVDRAMLFGRRGPVLPPREQMHLRDL